MLMIFAGSKHPALDWTEVALTAGVALAVVGISHIAKEVTGWDLEA